MSNIFHWRFIHPRLAFCGGADAEPKPMSSTGQIPLSCDRVGKFGAQRGVEERPTRVDASISGGSRRSILQTVFCGIGRGRLADWRPCDCDRGVVSVYQDDAFVHCKIFVYSLAFSDAEPKSGASGRGSMRCIHRLCSCRSSSPFDRPLRLVNENWKSEWSRPLSR